MALDFKKIGDVELLESVPDTANAVVEVDGAFKRVPGSNLGGGVKTAIIKASNYDNRVALLQTADSSDSVTYSCINMTFEEAYSTMAAGDPLVVLFMDVYEGAFCRYGTCMFTGTGLEEPAILLVVELSGLGLDTTIFKWTEGGIVKKSDHT